MTLGAGPPPDRLRRPGTRTMGSLNANPFDGVALVLILLGARNGHLRGFAEVIWPMLRWLAVLAAGASAWGPFGRRLSEVIGWSHVTGAEFAFLLMAGAAALAVAGLQRLLGDPLLASIPPGRADSFFGAVAGGIAAGAALLTAYALLNPFAMGTVQWSTDAAGSYDTAVEDLLGAILATVRNAAMEGSWIGRNVQEHLGALLIQQA